MPTYSTEFAAGFDLYMPEAGVVCKREAKGHLVGLGFAAEVPTGYVPLLMPRSGVGAKNGLALNNTIGVIDRDYRGEWLASFRVHNDIDFFWKAHDRLLQVLIVPVIQVALQEVEELNSTDRDTGGFGSTGT